MKISLAWVFDHIDVPFHTVDIPKVLELFTKHTAELEGWEKVSIDTNCFYVVHIAQVGVSISGILPENNETIDLPFRKDLSVGQYALVKKQGGFYAWATIQDFGCQKDGLLNAISMTLDQAQGGWKKFAHEDYIVIVDNKSINHRPDLWGHRGIAREIAAYMNYPLKPWNQVVQNTVACIQSEKAYAGDAKSFGMEIQEPHAIYKVAGWYCNSVQNMPSPVSMIFRLLHMQTRPLNALIDLTNYVMFDIGQPMHVFDAAGIENRSIVLRKAKSGETLQLLDGSAITLEKDDIVLADKKNPLSLVGIMGGSKSGVSLQTNSIFIEAVGLHAATIRKTAQRLKLRTEASMRFEKSLSPEVTVHALQRFIGLAQELGVLSDISAPLVSVGQEGKRADILIMHSKIEQTLGIQISEKTILEILEKLEFIVDSVSKDNDIEYIITAPSFRVVKDISIQADIIEEIARMYGYDNIVKSLPRRQMKPFALHETANIRTAKQILATHGKMHEVRDYLFYDESFLQRLQWYPEDAVAILNPVSENWKVLATSLIPHLLKAVELNSTQEEELRFFELNSIWEQKSDSILEQKQCSGVIFHQKKEVDFYQSKALLLDLFHALHIPVTIKKAEKVAPWYNPYQTANIYCGDLYIGTMGMLLPSFYRGVVSGSAFGFELHADFLAQYIPQTPKLVMWSKYQDVVQDISIMLPYAVTAQTCIDEITASHATICKVHLVDMYEKAEWGTSRSLTLRYTIQDFEKTLQREEIDVIVDCVGRSMQKLGAQIR